MTEPTIHILVDISGSTNRYREPLANSVQALHDALVEDEGNVEVAGYSCSADGQGPALYPGLDAIRDRTVGGASTPTGAAVLALDLQPHDTLILLTDGPEDKDYDGTRPPAKPILRELADQGVGIIGAIWGQEWGDTWNPKSIASKQEWLEEQTDLIFGDGHAAFYGETIEEAVQLIADVLDLGDLGIHTPKPEFSSEAPRMTCAEHKALHGHDPSMNAGL